MKIDWELMERQASARLQRMIRFDTTNPPGNELPLARHLAEELEGEGFSPQVFESMKERGSFAVRLEGDGSQRPVLLLSHLDVVPAEPKRWTHPPFGGEASEGFIWGRGAIDCKLAGAVGLQVLILCRRLRLPLKRDLLVVATGDEEYGGHWGAGWMAEHHPELFDAEYGLNEGGGFALQVDGRPFYTCQVGEKGNAPVDLTAHGKPGHSSVPHLDNPIFLLGRVLERLGREKMPHRVTESVRAFFTRAAEAQPDPKVAGLLQAMLVPEGVEEALPRLPVNEPTRLMFDAMVRNTCAPTVLSAGVKRNVIPSEATVQLSGRPLAGVDGEMFLSEVRRIVGEEVEMGMESFRPGFEFDHRTDLFSAVEASMKRWDPAGTVLPYMQTGGTDARFLRDRDLKIYGFLPMRYEPGLDIFELCHGHNERVSAANVRFATQVLFDVVCRLNGLE